MHKHEYGEVISSNHFFLLGLERLCHDRKLNAKRIAGREIDRRVER